ncbi:phenylalanine 4-monooxygenase [Vineibacter terrae]|uniref:Phenylalanine-4-hydroxylase n=1 Tax=Vineibacter terrae TaxID=2586908 RepID=A0A5C8PFL8_9HYPH|nr:phenylalanine 4-monooxygenase [Vineibacter terrae]TXL71969.1 phenylalanine 4-monooxygenase [Vineibacter terrae]
MLQPSPSPTAGLRGDYSRMQADWTVPQDPRRYGAEEQDIWRTLLRRQSGLARQHACPQFLGGLAQLDIDERIPDFSQVSDALARRTGWRVVGVPGLIPDDVFYGHLAHRRFPVTVWIRRRDELDYLVEPDLFHDFFGHVPLLADPVFADYMQAYGQRGVEAGAANIHRLARLYWYTVEFGLIRSEEGVKVFGAGIISSAKETLYAIGSPVPARIAFDAGRVMRTAYEIDKLQRTYFVLDDFRQLFDATQVDFPPLYAALARQPEIPTGTVLPHERLIAAAALPQAA